MKTGKTPVLEGAEWRKPLDSIPATTLRDLRDRALIAALTYGFVRISAALKTKAEDLRSRGAGWTIRLHEKDIKQHAMPCHYALAEALRLLRNQACAYYPDNNGSPLSDRAMSQPDAWLMIRRLAAATRHRGGNRVPDVPRHRDYRLPVLLVGTDELGSRQRYHLL